MLLERCDLWAICPHGHLIIGSLCCSINMLDSSVQKKDYFSITIIKEVKRLPCFRETPGNRPCSPQVKLVIKGALLLA
jgi:hypothetical protein